MQSNRYIGHAPSVAGNPIGMIDYFSAAPGGGWKAVKTLTERDIWKVRAAGGLPRKPRVLASQGISASLPPFFDRQAGSANGYNPQTSRHFFAMGPKSLFSGSSSAEDGNFTVGCAPYNSAIHGTDVGGPPARYGQTAVSLSTTISNSGNTLLGVSWANGELNLLSTLGIYASTFDRPAASNSTFVGHNAKETTTRYGTTAIDNDSAYNQLRYGNGKYVAFASGGGKALRYSTDRVTWTACAVAGLNADGAAAGASVAWCDWIDHLERFVAVTVYGEILTSADGITFIKTCTRAPGGATFGLTEFCVTVEGKVCAIGSGAGAGQFYTSPDLATGFSLTTVAIAGKTFGSRARGIGYTAGVLIASFDAASDAPAAAQTVYTVDGAATWKVFSGGDGSMSSVYVTSNCAGPVLCFGGTAIMVNRSSGLVNAPGQRWDRVTTDFGQAVALAIHDDTYAQPRGVGSKLTPYMRTA